MENNKEFKELQALITFEWGCIKKYLVEKDSPLSDEEWDELVSTLSKKGRELNSSLYSEKIKKTLVCLLDFIENKYYKLKKNEITVTAETKMQEQTELHEVFQFGWKIIKEYAVNQTEPLDTKGWESLMGMSKEFTKKQDSLYKEEIGNFILQCLDFVEVKYTYLISEKQEKRAV